VLLRTPGVVKNGGYGERRRRIRRNRALRCMERTQSRASALWRGCGRWFGRVWPCSPSELEEGMDASDGTGNEVDVMDGRISECSTLNAWASKSGLEASSLEMSFPSTDGCRVCGWAVKGL